VANSVYNSPRFWDSEKPHMKCIVHFEVEVLLFCGVFLFAQTTPPSEQKPAPPAKSTDQNGKYGLGQGRQATAAMGPLDVLSDTQGVDFGPYLKRVVDDVRRNWYTLIPESARAPIMKKGKVSIEFAIKKDGRIAGIQLVGPSGDVALDRAAYGGITSNNPFAPLPPEFSGQYLALRFTFYYNPDRSELAAIPTNQRSSKSGITVIVLPHDSVEVPIGGSEVVTASVKGSKDPAPVTWGIAGQGCSGATCGIIDDQGSSEGLYKAVYHAPSALPDPPSVTVTAVWLADPTASDSVTVHLVPAPKP
jgi:TonB family protein